MRLRHHRQTALRSMRTAAMDDYFFNELKSHPFKSVDSPFRPVVKVVALIAA